MTHSNPIRGARAIGIVALGLVSLSIILTPPASGYEPSLIHGFGAITWICFSVAILAGLWTLYTAVPHSQAWYAGVAEVLATYLVFFLLPLLRGYEVFATPSADQWLHFAHTEGMLSTGLLPDGVFYPASHILYTAVSAVTGLGLPTIQLLVGWVFMCTFIFGMYALGKQSFKSQNAGAACLLAAAPLVFTTYHPTMMPWLYALMLAPIGLSLVHLRDRITSSVPAFVGLVVIAAAIAFFHPLTMLLFVLMIFVHEFYHHRIGAVVIGHQTQISRRLPSLTVGLVATTALLVWHLSFQSVEIAVRRTAISLVGGDPGASTYASNATESSYTTLELIWNFLVFDWGPTVGYLGVGALVILVGGWRWFRRRHVSEGDLLVSTQFIVGFGVALTFVIFNLMTINVVRITQYAMIFAILLVGRAIWEVQYHSEAVQ